MRIQNASEEFFLFALYSGNDDIISAECTYQQPSRGITPGTYAGM